MRERREFLDAENVALYAFSIGGTPEADYGFGMDEHQVRRWLQESRVLSVSRAYLCDCGHAASTPHAIWEHVATAHTAGEVDRG